MQKELDELKTPGGSVHAAMKKTFKAIMKGRKIDQKKKDLSEYQKVLDTRILTRLDTKAVLASQAFETLKNRLLEIDSNIEKSRNQVVHTLSERINRTTIEQEFMQSLYFADIFTRQEQILDARKKSFEWIFAGSQEWGEKQSTPGPNFRGWWYDRASNTWSNFREWLESRDRASRIYHVRGKAGSGKSTLMNFVVQDRRTRKALYDWCGGAINLLTPSFFFWKAGSALQKSVQGLLRSVAYQMLKNEPSLLEDLSISQCKYGYQLLTEAQAWTTHRLLSILEIILNTAAARKVYVCFFLDGLDEYDGESDLLLDWIDTAAKKENVKMCISSRPEEPYRRRFAHAAQLSLQELTQEDIYNYIKDRLENSLLTIQGQHRCLDFHCQCPRGSCPYWLMQILQEKALGVFLWVRFVVRDLLSGIEMGDTLQNLWQRLDDTPSEIYHLYAHMLGKVSSNSSCLDHTRRCFALMLANEQFPSRYSYFHRRLTLLDFALAEESIWNKIHSMDQTYLSEDTMAVLCSKLEKRIKFCCAGLAEIGCREKYRTVLLRLPPSRDKSQRVSFVHRTVVDFLKEDGGSVFASSKEYGSLLLARAMAGHCVINFYYVFGRRMFVSYRQSIIDYPLAMLAEQALTLEAIDIDKDEHNLRAANEEVIHMTYRIFKLHLETTHSQGGFPPGRDDMDDPIRLAWFLQYNDETEFWTDFGFSRALRCLVDCRISSRTYWNRILDLTVAGLYVRKIDFKHHIQIFITALERGARCDTMFLVQTECWPQHMWDIRGIAMLQNSWTLFVLHALRLYLRDPVRDAPRTQLLVDLFEYSLKLGISPNSPSLALWDHGYQHQGVFVAELSILSIVESIPPWPGKEKILQYLADSKAQRCCRFRYFVRFPYVYEMSKEFMDSCTIICHELIGAREEMIGSRLFWKGKELKYYSTLVQMMENNIRQARKLGCCITGFVLGDETTYKKSTKHIQRA